MAFLERGKDDFVSIDGGGQGCNCCCEQSNQGIWVYENSGINTCRSKLKGHMQYCVEHPKEKSKLAKVKAQVSEVKGVMMENIEKDLILRSENILLSSIIRELSVFENPTFFTIRSIHSS